MGKRFRRKIKHTGKAFGTAFSVAKQALNTALKVKSLINVEFKHVDTAPNAWTVASGGVVLAMNAIAEGDASNERDGLSVRNKSLYLRATISEHASAQKTLIRMMIVKDQQPNGTTPAITDILEAADWRALMNNINTRRFKVLVAKDYALSNNGNGIVQDNIYKELNFHTKYLGSGGAATDIGYNGIYLVALSNQPTYTPTIDYSARIRYIDN